MIILQWGMYKFQDSYLSENRNKANKKQKAFHICNSKETEKQYKFYEVYGKL